MNIKEILSVFSNRKKNKNVKVTIGNETRNRILMILNKRLSERDANSFSFIDRNDFQNLLLQVREMFQLKLGRMNLSNSNKNSLEDILIFVSNCEGNNFLDFLEYIFKVKEVYNAKGDIINRIVNDINYILEQDEVLFRLTRYVEEWVEASRGEMVPYNGIPFGSVTTRNIIAYPQVISKDDDFTYSEIITPVLEILRDPRFTNANKEFLEALDNYKNMRYKECITSCCSSLESVIKIIFKIKRLEYNTNSTLNPLIDQLTKQTDLYDWLKTVLATPATIRNKLGSSHGKGDQSVVANKNEARYQINTTASEIIFLIDELL